MVGVEERPQVVKVDGRLEGVEFKQFLLSLATATKRLVFSEAIRIIKDISLISEVLSMNVDLGRMLIETDPGENR